MSLPVLPLLFFSLSCLSSLSLSCSLCFGPMLIFLQIAATGFGDYLTAIGVFPGLYLLSSCLSFDVSLSLSFFLSLSLSVFLCKHMCFLCVRIFLTVTSLQDKMSFSLMHMKITFLLSMKEQ